MEIREESASKNPNPLLYKKPSTYKQREATALRELRKLADDREVWAGLTKKLCGVMEKL